MYHVLLVVTFEGTSGIIETFLDHSNRSNPQDQQMVNLKQKD